MENGAKRKEIEDIFEVCHNSDRCGRKNIQEKKVEKTSFLFCATCAMVLPEGESI